ncbi:MAG: CDP-archaeol synthase [Proteobacteria bacterium]|nr:CDP-archaeol synthase [Pseudomonadota bacterium]
MNIPDLIFLIIVANAAPILVTYAMRNRFDYPLDGRFILADGQRVFGDSKTIRGIVAAIVFTAIAALMIGHPGLCGILVGAYAMLGDLLSSFLKRRIRLPSSSRAPVLDQLPEALLPTVILAPYFGLATGDVIVIVVTFLLVAVTVSPMLYNVGIRATWY